MKRIAKKGAGIVAMVALTLGATMSAYAQNALEDTRYGATAEERKTNLGKLNFLSDAYNAKNWNEAAVYVRDLMNDAPNAHSSIYVWGATTYSQKAARATSVAEKKIYVDSVMLIYDRRVQHFGSADPNRGTPYILQMKANAYLGLNPMDREGVRKFYKEAVEAAGANVKADLVLAYFQQLVNDFKGTIITPEELLVAYEELQPKLANATQEERDGFTGLFATSGAADCAVLEELYTKELAAKPGDVDVLGKAFNLMSMAGCETPFYFSVAEQYYAAAPSTDVAIRLATMFEKQEQFEKALKYLGETIPNESSPTSKANLYVRVAASELGLKRSSAAAQAARQAIALDSSNGIAHMLLAEAYAGGAAQCGGFHGQTVYWLAYDELIRAREADPSLNEAATSRMASFRGSFPTKEDGFMYIEGYADGKSYTVNCGWVSGTTTIRSR
jgi:tetratricopeptide (TPR) repeat protein